MPRPLRLPVGPGHRWRIGIGTLALAAATVAGACSSGSETAVQTLPPRTTPPSTMAHASGTAAAPARGEAVIDSFDLRSQLSCTGAIDITVSTTYATTGAESVAFVIDGDQVPGSPPTSGSFELPITCDDRSHTVVLVAVDAAGGTTVESRVLLATTTPLGN